MSHFTSPQYWKHYYSLPQNVQEIADNCFTLLKANPQHPSLHFKNTGRFWSVRVGIHWRALAVQKENDFVWFWIGSHSEYDKML